MTDLGSFSLEGKNIVVTGANTGIGQGIAVSVSRAGGSVIGVGRSDMTETAHMIEMNGGKFTPVLRDLSDVDQAIRVIDEIWQECGAIDGLVNNAGIIRRADALDFTLEDWDEVMDVNLRSVFFMSQALASIRHRSRHRSSHPSLLIAQPAYRHPSFTARWDGVTAYNKAALSATEAEGPSVSGSMAPTT